MKYGFGVDLGGTTVKIAFFDETGLMMDKWEIPTVTANGGSRILPDIAASIQQFIEQKTIDPASVIGVGIGVPGPVNSKVVTRNHQRGATRKFLPRPRNRGGFGRLRGAGTTRPYEFVCGCQKTARHILCKEQITQ